MATAYKEDMILKLSDIIAYNKKEVADRLKVPESTVGYLIRNGKLPAVKIGRRYVVRHNTLEKWLEDNESL